MNSTTMRSTGNSGFTIIENIVAVGIIALGFAALYAMSARCMKIMYSARDEMTVGQALQDRADRLRKCTWAQITDPAYLSGNIMNTAANKGPLMKNVTETVTINAYPTAASPAIQLRRSSAGVVTIVTSNASIANGDLATINIEISWNSSSGSRPHTAAISTLFAEDAR